MSHLKTMSASLVIELISGQEDLLTPEANKMADFFSNLLCPECGDSVRPVLDTHRPFRPGSVLPNYLAECINCSCLFTPHTMIIVRQGDRTKQGDYE